MVVAGRSPHCTLARALRAHETNSRHFALRAEIEKSSRVIERIAELDIQLWEIPNGRIWYPGKENPSFLLAEQVRQIYGDPEQGVHTADVVLDCGAHVGVFHPAGTGAGG